ncbi:MAG: hypothetical protein JWP04_446 [Belnapia sp.]|nr:hypothetical protein [Belnapia sp.]
MPEIPPWLAGLVSILTPVSFAAWQIYLYATGRFDKREDAREAAEDKQLHMLAGQRDRITDDLRTDLDTCRDMLAATSADRYRGWDLARIWYDRAWAMRHQAIHARQYGESFARVHGVEPPVWTVSLDLPPFDPPH